MSNLKSLLRIEALLIGQEHWKDRSILYDVPLFILILSVLNQNLIIDEYFLETSWLFVARKPVRLYHMSGQTLFSAYQVLVLMKHLFT